MRIGFYDPYFDSYGGGERYCLTLASHWSKTHDVVLFWDDESVIKESSRRFNLDLTRIKVVQNIFRGQKLFKKLLLSYDFDIIFFLSDGSIPSTLARINILHFQVPFKHLQLNPIKLSRYQYIICNSLYTKNNLNKRLQSRTRVIYPPVTIGQFIRGKKEKMILSVGRFSAFYQAKKQEVLIRAFKKMQAEPWMKGWRLVLIGGLLGSDRNYFDFIQNLAKDLPITVLTNVSFTKLRDSYSKASIYWHAAGFGETNPQNMEHFGISTVEAMASGCVPIVYNSGGLPEIVSDKEGYLWLSEWELIEYTKNIIQDLKHREDLARKSLEKAQNFDVSRFTENLDELIFRSS